jgi:hypothetical protein
MNLHSRIQRLEKKSGGHGACPGCGYRPDDIRVIEVALSAGPDLPPLPPQTPLCGTCGREMPPVRIVERFQEQERLRAQGQGNDLAEK